MASNESSQGSFQGFKVEELQQTILSAESVVKAKLNVIKDKSTTDINIGDMFDMQWMMNKFAQLSELASAVLASAHGAISAMTRNLK